jgi:hypothetical protein
MNIERNATSVPMLDAANAWAECKKLAWASQGWTEVHPHDREEKRDADETTFFSGWRG